MKVKTSLTLSEELLKAISNQTQQEKRSAFIEEASWRLLRERQLEERDRQELAAIDAHADELNVEAVDVLEYQDHA